MMASRMAHNNAPKNGQSTHANAMEIAASKMRNERSSDVLTYLPAFQSLVIRRPYHNIVAERQVVPSQSLRHVAAAL
ncbi:hypothetical protein ABIA42_006822 [Bradyrhizobium sp. USDA 327]